MNERHQGKKAVIGDTEDPNFAVALGNVLHQLVDRVIGVGRLVHRRRVLRPMDGTVHDEIAFRSVFAPYVLNNANVAALNNYIRLIVVTFEDRTEMSADGMARQRGRVVGRARKQDGRMGCSLRYEDDGVKSYSVANRDHDIAANIVEVIGCGVEFRRRLAWQRWIRNRRLSESGPPCT